MRLIFIMVERESPAVKGVNGIYITGNGNSDVASKFRNTHLHYFGYQGVH